jgi:polyhydroxyalkanoate synthase
MADYILRGEIDAVDTIRDLLDVPSVHTIGYCVAGTALAAGLGLLAERGEADKIASATFFTAQVDFEHAGDLTLFIDGDQMELIQTLSKDTGYLDGRYMAATFNLLRGRDLIWNYVTNNYLLGQDYPPFDLLHWNGDTTNLPVKWHRAYLEDLYRDNKLAKPGAYCVEDTPDRPGQGADPRLHPGRARGPYRAAAKRLELKRHLSGPTRFVLAGRATSPAWSIRRRPANISIGSTRTRRSRR